jgi:hypothetical protein
MTTIPQNFHLAVGKLVSYRCTTIRLLRKARDMHGLKNG